MDKRDYYEVLGLDRTASMADIKKAYRNLAKKHHPDLNAGDAEAEQNFKQITEAYECLKNEETRARYDQFGHDGLRHGPGGGRGGAGFDGFGSMGDIFEEFFGGGGTRTRGRRRRQGPQRGADLRYDLEISLTDAFAGTSRKIRINSTIACENCKGSGAKPGTSPVVCPTCQGNGMVRTQQGPFSIERPCHACGGVGQSIAEPCGTCQGKGVGQKERILSFDVPQGVEDGTRIRLAGEGNAGLRGGPRGDLYVFIHVQPHPHLQRDGADLFCQVPVRMTDAAMGGAIEIPLLDGKKIKVTIPQGAQSGQQFRLRGKGMPVLQTAKRHGDLYVQLAVEIPNKLDDKQKELLQQFTDSLNADCFPQSEAWLAETKDKTDKQKRKKA